MLRGALHGQGGHVAQRGQQLQRLGAAGRRLHGLDCASCRRRGGGGGEAEGGDGVSSNVARIYQRSHGHIGDRCFVIFNLH